MHAETPPPPPPRLDCASWKSTLHYTRGEQQDLRAFPASIFHEHFPHIGGNQHPSAASLTTRSTRTRELASRRTSLWKSLHYFWDLIDFLQLSRNFIPPHPVLLSSCGWQEAGLSSQCRDHCMDWRHRELPCSADCNLQKPFCSCERKHLLIPKEAAGSLLGEGGGGGGWAL